MKNIGVDIPRNKLVVITGPSGSGKSSLAFDTIYAEGQRRYLENLSDYPKQFLNFLKKPEVDQIENLSPAIAIDDKSAAKTPRSTVGTMTEIYDYLRLLFSRCAEARCVECGAKLKKNTIGQIVEKILGFPKNTELIILAPIMFSNDNGSDLNELISKFERAGYLRMRLDGKIYLSKELVKKKFKKDESRSLEIVIDKITIGEKKTDYARTLDSVETALEISEGVVIASPLSREGWGCIKKAEIKSTPNPSRKGNNHPPLAPPKKGIHNDLFFSDKLFCHKCQLAFPEVEPKLFSFNSPIGACPVCAGLGVKLKIDPSLIIPNKSLTLAEGAIRPWANVLNGREEHLKILNKLSKKYEFSLHVPAEKISQKILKVIFYGENPSLKIPLTSFNKRENYDDGGGENYWQGVISFLEKKYYETNSDYLRNELKKYMVVEKCPLCQGKRLRKEALAMKLFGRSISELAEMPIHQAIEVFKEMEKDNKIARPLISEISKRLKLLDNIGLGYLSLGRSSETLSSGEARRIRLATQLSSQLTGILYFLDEPSVGLHQRDNDKLLEALEKLRDLGNSVLVMEHDDFFIRAADWIIDIGPGAGETGGKIIAQGNLKHILRSNCLTGKYLSGREKIATPKKRRKGNKKSVIIEGAREHNLKNITVEIPLEKFVCVTGVSGSGKSSLINNVLAKLLARKFHRAQAPAGKHKKIKGLQNLSKVISIDQSPIGRTPRSNPATYTEIFTHIRDLFVETKEAKSRNYKTGRFSFNAKGGRCESCAGEGMKKIEMHFLPAVYVECEECHGQRYNRETLEIEYRGMNIAEVLEMTIGQARKFFRGIAPLDKKLGVLNDVGLGYMKLGQPATTLSGGEAQRIKLAAELARPAKEGRTLYILDEPTVGLHFDDIKKLLGVLNKLVDRGNTVLVIEHNLDVIKNADWIIDLGPEGGDKGGYLIFCGAPNRIGKCKKSWTGRYLNQLFINELTN